ncbi:MAG: hypothetical protein K2W82_18075 [Candidatus Obscuribacterales bacterium]|nr:hypothetical protein [Candidatus Obscuribacterales bacterium]
MLKAKSLILLALVLVIACATKGFAEEPLFETRHFSFKDVPHDPSKNETKRAQALTSDNKLVKELVSFADGSQRIFFYRENGSLSGISDCSPNYNSITKTRFQEDGKTKTAVIEMKRGEVGLSRQPAVVKETHYYPDGKSVCRIKEYPIAGSVDHTDKYFAQDGKILVCDTHKGLETESVFYNVDGKQDYKQLWIDAIDGPYLLMVEEVTASGVYRRVHFRGGVKKVEYLKADGSVERTEEAGKGFLKLAEPVNPERLKPIQLP